jgi:integrase
MGSIYKRGNTWWLDYAYNGQRIRESSKTDKKFEAERLLKEREGEIAKGKRPGFCFDRFTFKELADDLITNYRIKGNRSIERARISIKHLSMFFGRYKATGITSQAVNRYIEHRQNEGASNGTINRELAAMRRMLNLGARQIPPKVSRDNIPVFELLKESDPKQGFFEEDEFLALRDALPDYLKGLVTFGYFRGGRVSEYLNLKWENVRGKFLRLSGSETKNGRPRAIPLDIYLMRILETQKEGNDSCPYVFHKGGQPIRDFRYAWTRACNDIGFNGYKITANGKLRYWQEGRPQRTFHDFRRTAARNMIRSGMNESYAMMITGHRSRSVFERYNIINETDLLEAAERMNVTILTQSEESTGKKKQEKLGKIIEFK